MTVSSWFKAYLVFIKQTQNEPRLTLTFDPSTLDFVQLQALINGNVMCDYDQNPCPRFSTPSPIISRDIAYFPLSNTTYMH